MPERVDLGYGHHVNVKAEAGTGVLNLVITNETGEKQVERTSRESLRGLWANLTGILFPRAADQLTKRISTVKRSKEEVPNDVTYSVTAYVSEKTPDAILLTGMSRLRIWTLRISHEVGDSLWTELEDHLDQV